MTYPHFPEVDQERMNPEFMSLLITLRKELDFPFRITSHFRDEKKKGAHYFGRAVDINVWGERAYILINSAEEYGMTGIGISQKGPTNKRFLHLDNMSTTDKRPRPWVWTY